MLSSQFKKKSKLPTQSKTVLAVSKNRLILQHKNEEEDKEVLVPENNTNGIARGISLTNFISQCEGLESGENDHQCLNEKSDGFRFSFDIPSESCNENNRSFGFNFDIETGSSGNRDIAAKSKKKNKKRNKKKRQQNLKKLNGIDNEKKSSNNPEISNVNTASKVPLPHKPAIESQLQNDEDSLISLKSLHTPTSSYYNTSRNDLFTVTSNDESSPKREQTKIMPPPGFKEIISPNKVNALNKNEIPPFQINCIPQNNNNHNDITMIDSLSKNATENIFSTTQQTQSPTDCQGSFRFNSPVKVKTFINHGSLTVRKDRNKQFGKSIPHSDHEKDDSRKPGCPNAFSFGFDFRNLLASGSTSTTPD